MNWNTISKKINYIFLLSLTEVVRIIVRFFLKDAEIFLKRYPLLTAEPSAAWHYFRLSVGDILEYGSAKRPLFIKLVVLFWVLIGFSVISLGVVMGFNQAKTLQNQATALICY
jgi:hypothetical protein